MSDEMEDMVWEWERYGLGQGPEQTGPPGEGPGGGSTPPPPSPVIETKVVEPDDTIRTESIVNYETPEAAQAALEANRQKGIIYQDPTTQQTIAYKPRDGQSLEELRRLIAGKHGPVSGYTGTAKEWGKVEKKAKEKPEEEITEEAIPLAEGLDPAELLKNKVIAPEKTISAMSDKITWGLVLNEVKTEKKKDNLIKNIWRAVTPWNEDIGETFLKYTKDYPKRVKETFAQTYGGTFETQEELKMAYASNQKEKEELKTAPLWAKLLFPAREDVVYDKKTRTYYRVLMGEAPATGGKKAAASVGAAVEKAAEKVAETRKVATISPKEAGIPEGEAWQRFIKARVDNPKLTPEEFKAQEIAKQAPKIDWKKVTDAIDNGKIKSAQDAARAEQGRQVKTKEEVLAEVKKAMEAARKAEQTRLQAESAKQAVLKEKYPEVLDKWQAEMARVVAKQPQTAAAAKKVAGLVPDIRRKMSAKEEAAVKEQLKPSTREQIGAKSLTELSPELQEQVQQELQTKVLVSTILSTALQEATQTQTQTKTKTQTATQTKTQVQEEVATAFREAVQQKVQAIEDTAIKEQVQEQIQELTNTTMTTPEKPPVPTKKTPEKPPVRPPKRPPSIPVVPRVKLQAALTNDEKRRVVKETGGTAYNMGKLRIKGELVDIWHIRLDSGRRLVIFGERPEGIRTLADGKGSTTKTLQRFGEGKLNKTFTNRHGAVTAHVSPSVGRQGATMSFKVGKIYVTPLGEATAYSRRPLRRRRRR